MAPKIINFVQFYIEILICSWFCSYFVVERQKCAELEKSISLHLLKEIRDFCKNLWLDAKDEIVSVDSCVDSDGGREGGNSFNKRMSREKLFSLGCTVYRRRISLFFFPTRR